jgi:hypothetical protein
VAGWVARGRAGRRGRPRTYSDAAITCMLTLKAVYRLPLRATTGLVRSLLALLGIPLPVADPATLSRRAHTLRVLLPVGRPAAPLHLVVDATGLKVYGAGEWRVRQSGWTQHRTWLKVHLGLDVTQELRVAGVSTAAVTDGEMLPALLATERAPLAQVTGDGLYDEWRCWAAVAAAPNIPARVFPPPRPRCGPKRARIKQHGNCRRPPLDRDQHIRRIRQVGRQQWKKEVGYHQRSLAETAIYRFKTLFGDGVSARTFVGQMQEVFIRCAALNRMTARDARQLCARRVTAACRTTLRQRSFMQQRRPLASEPWHVPVGVLNSNPLLQPRLFARTAPLDQQLADVTYEEVAAVTVFENLVETPVWVRLARCHLLTAQRAAVRSVSHRLSSFRRLLIRHVPARLTQPSLQWLAGATNWALCAASSRPGAARCRAGHHRARSVATCRSRRCSRRAPGAH